MKLESLSKNEINPGGQPVWVHFLRAFPNSSPISQSPGTMSVAVENRFFAWFPQLSPTCGCLGHLLPLSNAYGVIDVVSFWGLSCMNCGHVSPRYLHPAESINHVIDSDLVRGRLCVQLRHGEDPMHWQNHDPNRWYLQPSEVCA